MKRNNAQLLEKIYKRIPAMECAPECSECCGPILMCKTEWARFKEHKPIVSKELICPYLVDGKCSEYENRPFICRLFGTTEKEGRLTCPRGCRPKKMLTIRQELHLCHLYEELSSSEGDPVGPALSLSQALSWDASDTLKALEGLDGKKSN